MRTVGGCLLDWSNKRLTIAYRIAMIFLLMVSFQVHLEVAGTSEINYGLSEEDPFDGFKKSKLNHADTNQSDAIGSWANISCHALDYTKRSRRPSLWWMELQRLCVRLWD